MPYFELTDETQERMFIYYRELNSVVNKDL